MSFPLFFTYAALMETATNETRADLMVAAECDERLDNAARVRLRETNMQLAARDAARRMNT